MDVFIMHYKYRFKHIVVVDGDVFLYKYENYKFD